MAVCDGSGTWGTCNRVGDGAAVLSAGCVAGPCATICAAVLGAKKTVVCCACCCNRVTCLSRFCRPVNILVTAARLGEFVSMAALVAKEKFRVFSAHARKHGRVATLCDLVGATCGHVNLLCDARPVNTAVDDALDTCPSCPNHSLALCSCCTSNMYASGILHLHTHDFAQHICVLCG